MEHLYCSDVSTPCSNMRPCLAGLHERLQHQLRPEPCQTGASPSAPAPEPRKSRSLEHFGLRGARKSWLRPAPCGSSRLLPTLPPGGHAVGGHRRELATAAEPRRPAGTRAGGAGWGAMQSGDAERRRRRNGLWGGGSSRGRGMPAGRMELVGRREVGVGGGKGPGGGGWIRRRGGGKRKGG